MGVAPFADAQGGYWHKAEVKHFASMVAIRGKADIVGYGQKRRE
jgi:hypothetical protein